LKIRVNISNPDSIKNAVDKITAYEKKLDEKIKTVLTRLAKMGTQLVDYHFSSGEGTEFEVTCVVNGNNAMIIAEGDDVVFLEFGAGFGTDDHTDGMETSGLPPIYPGSWSETEGTGQFIRKGYWYWNKQKYTSVTSTKGFYFASKEIKDQAVDVAIKVFKR